MFTGLVKDVGKIITCVRNPEGLQIEIETALLSEIEIDDSVAVNGVCQTVTKKTSNTFFIQAIKTTLEKTNFNQLKVQDKVNLELALRASDRLGGHFVQGHVSGVGEVVRIENFGEARKIWLKVPEDQKRYMMKEGSVALDGISLTLADVDSAAAKIAVSIIPHTMAKTIINYWKLGTKVNIEADLLAKFVENLLLYTSHRTSVGVSSEKLKTFLED